MTRSNITGWIAVVLTTAVSAAWASWGTIENFHEGWFSPSLWRNLLWTLAYLSLMLIWTGSSLLAIRWPKAGAAVICLLGLGLSAFVLSTRRHIDAGLILGWLPLLGGFGLIGLLWWFGSPRPKRLAYIVAAGVPLLVAMVCAAEPVYRIAHRFDDGDRGARLVRGNGIALVWAPAGPGWPSEGVDFAEAERRAQFLSPDGLRLMDTPQNIWRLPAVEEIAASLTRGGQNAGGVWNSARGRAEYQLTPDKEAPLWNPHSPIIYWWSATREGDKAYRIVYNGRVDLLPVRRKMGSLAFRAVRCCRGCPVCWPPCSQWWDCSE